MFWNTKKPSSGGKHLCLAKVTCGSMVQVHVNSVSIVAAYITLARHRCSSPEDGSFVFRNMLGLFLYVILYVFLMRF